MLESLSSLGDMLAEARGHQRRRKLTSSGLKILGKLSVPQFRQG